MLRKLIFFNVHYVLFIDQMGHIKENQPPQQYFPLQTKRFFRVVGFNSTNLKLTFFGRIAD